MSTDRDELAELIASAEYPNMNPPWAERKDRSPVKYYSRKYADVLIAAGYRKPRQITEYSIVFNGHASGLIPPATSIAEFQERYERETGWMLTDRDVYIQRTFQTIDPEFGDWELMPTTAPEPLP